MAQWIGFLPLVMYGMPLASAEALLPLLDCSSLVRSTAAPNFLHIRLLKGHSNLLGLVWMLGLTSGLLHI